MKLTEGAAAELVRTLGRDRVLTDEADLLAYAYDGALDRARPEAIVFPRSAEEVRSVVRICLGHKIPYVARGAGTNLSGGCIPLRGGIIVSLARMNAILQIDTNSCFALVEPGVVNLRLQKELEPLGYFYAPDPASFKVCTIGGNVAENAGGPRCLKYGVTSNHVLALEAAMPDGELARFRVDEPGPDLTGLLVGAEGTLGVVTKAWLRILPLPRRIHTLLVSFGSMEDAIRGVADTVAAGIVPRTLEAMDRMTIEAVEAHVHAGYSRGAEAVLLVELDGQPAAVERETEQVLSILKRRGAMDVRSATDEQDRERLWEGRRGAYAAMARIAPNVLVEDGVVPRDKLPEALKRIREISEKHQARTGLLFHAGDGNLHPNIVFDERNLAETKRVKRAGYEILKACVALGGSVSGEHGIGVDKRAAMAWLLPPPTLQLFSRIKKAMDPERLSNPDKILPLSGDGDPSRSLFRPPPPPLSAAAEELVAKVRAGSAFQFVGRGTRFRPERKDAETVSLAGLDRVIDVDGANYTATVEAGIPLKALREAVEAKGFHAPVPSQPGSLGGLIATKAWPGFRDYILGMRVLLPNGEVAELGGKVVKNVAGYDVPKLLFGSWGAYAVILEATFKILSEPLPPHPKSAAPEPPKDPGLWPRRLKEAFDPANRFNPWVFGGRP